MISAIEIGNFQAYELVTGGDFISGSRIEFSKLNLIYGPNSSGKSSIFRALKFLNNNICSMNGPSRSLWNFRADGLDLADYRAAVRNHDIESPMLFEIELSEKIACEKREKAGFELTLEKHFKDSKTETEQITSPKYGDDWFEFKVTVAFLLENPGRIRGFLVNVQPAAMPTSSDPDQLKGFQLVFTAKNDSQDGTAWLFESSSISESALSFMQKMNELKPRQKNTASRDAFDRLSDEEIRNALRNLRIAPTFTDDISFTGTNDEPSLSEEPVYSEIEDFLDWIWGLLQKNLRIESYVEPVREIPDVVNRADSPLIAQLLGMQGIFQEVSGNLRGNGLRRISRGTLDELSMDEAKTWFRNLTEGEYDFELSPIFVEGLEHELYALYVLNGDAKVGFKNVGVGLSQILPVIVALFPINPNPGQLALLEQPELHLHPKMQGKLTDAICVALSDRPSRQIFIETHSENMVLRALKNIRISSDAIDEGLELAQNALSADDLSITYVSKELGTSKVTQPRFSIRGEMLDPWPLNFVDLRIQDIF